MTGKLLHMCIRMCSCYIYICLIQKNVPITPSLTRHSIMAKLNRESKKLEVITLRGRVSVLEAENKMLRDEVQKLLNKPATPATKKKLPGSRAAAG